MKRKIPILVLLLLLLITGCFYLLRFTSVVIPIADMPLLVKKESWGPCPPGATCNKETILYYSGKVVITGSENYTYILSEDQMNLIRDAIDDRELMTKECEDTILLDYTFTYTLHVDGATREFTNTTCAKDFGEIDSLYKK